MVWQTCSKFGKTLKVLYDAENMLTPARLAAVKRFERELRALPGFAALCAGAGAACDPGESLVPWVRGSEIQFEN